MLNQITRIPACRLPRWPVLILSGYLAVAGGAAQAQEEGTDAEYSSGVSILDRSPFLPPGWAPPESNRPERASRQQVAGYEFRGVYTMRGKYRFLVSEPRSRDGKWVELGEAYENFEVRDYNPDAETLTLYFNNKEEEIALSTLEANPTPMPVSGQAPDARTASTRNDDNKPVRRTIRPATRSAGGNDDRQTPPPPAWLQKLREEAAKRRAQAVQSEAGGSGGGPINASSGRPDYTPPPPPTGAPPTPPPNLSEIEIPPPPTNYPPPPPPEVLEQMGSAWPTAPGS